MSLLWKLGGVALGCLAAYFLVTAYAEARYQRGKSDERVTWQDKVVAAERGKLAAFQAGLARQQVAEVRYQEVIRQLPPVTNTIIERAATYAQTPDGVAMCLPAERVQLLAGSRAALFSATTAADPLAAVAPMPAEPAPAER